MNIYVANISFKASNTDLKELLEEYGDVSSAKIIIDKGSQRSRGFGFVEMGDDAAARQAIAELNGASFQGKNLNVTQLVRNLKIPAAVVLDIVVVESMELNDGRNY